MTWVQLSQYGGLEDDVLEGVLLKERPELLNLLFFCGNVQQFVVLGLLLLVQVVEQVPEGGDVGVEGAAVRLQQAVEVGNRQVLVLHPVQHSIGEDQVHLALQRLNLRVELVPGQGNVLDHVGDARGGVVIGSVLDRLQVNVQGEDLSTVQTRVEQVRHAAAATADVQGDVESRSEWRISYLNKIQKSKITYS